jgi:hypothetical protein
MLLVRIVAGMVYVVIFVVVFDSLVEDVEILYGVGHVRELWYIINAPLAPFIANGAFRVLN